MKKPTTLKESLKEKLTKKELENLVASYDIIGDIAIIEIPAELEKKEKLIAETLLDLHKQIKVVVKKAGIHRGIYRRQKLKILAGERRKTTEYKENNVRIRLHAEDVYFSPRLATERKRIAELIKPEEEILVMFSGVAPYPLVIAKNTKAKEVYAIEINPIAHKFALENVKLNKTENIKLFRGDVRIVIPTIKKKFDRIIMPLPLTGENFLDTALTAANKKAVVHFYDFLKEEEFNLAKEKIKKACDSAKRKFKILRIVKAGQIKPREYRVCIDFSVY
ncbi:class I SAM-dependent methyltransferase family protein [Candidatus Woesearchaeota archaeon]|nr:class I SAM-dependent methyltransferase family protein [Candidatus Woesearchaeota archaeon]